MSGFKKTYVILSAYFSSTFFIIVEDSSTNISRLWIERKKGRKPKNKNHALKPPSSIFVRRSRNVSNQWTPLRYSRSEYVKDCDKQQRMDQHLAPASSASRFARTVRKAGFSRPPRPSFTDPLLSRNPINWFSCFLPKDMLTTHYTQSKDIPWWARSEKAVADDGDRFRPPGALLDGRRSNAPKGCGAVTAGRNGFEGFGLELFWSEPWSSGGIEVGETEPAALFWSCDKNACLTPQLK
jgi:hypothetical protein